MPVIRYRDVSEMPPAILGDADMTPTEGLRMACELSSVALRLAGITTPTERVRRVHPADSEGRGYPHPTPA